MPAFTFRSTFTSYEIEGSAFYLGKVHLVETSTGFGDGTGTPSRSRLVRLGDTGIEEVASLQGWKPWLLADGGRLWMISQERMGILEGGTLKPVEMPEPLGDIHRPFLYQGAPTLVERRPDGARLMAWRGDGWRGVQPLPGIDCNCGIQALAASTGVLLFRSDERTLYALNTSEERPSWSVVMPAPSHWYASEIDGKPAVAAIDSESDFRVVASDGPRWRTAGIRQRMKGIPGSLAAFQAHAGSPLTLLTQSFPGSLKLTSWDGQRFLDEKRFGQSMPFPKGMLLVMVVPQVAVMFLSLALAAVLSGLMRAYRVCTYVHEGTEVPFASLTRRALSQVIDSVIVAAPAAAIAWRTFSDFDSLFESAPSVPWRFFALLGGIFAWVVIAFLAFSVTEGLWGASPGKWITGIRVFGTDLSPCGFGRALLRNLLKLVDGFFNFLVGILMVAYTESWQRLGDLAARTIVIRTPGARGLTASSGGREAGRR
jgi:uncharacterized RDD family membrane protein YckC